MARTGFWFQRARGRALRRGNAMKEARRIQRILRAGDVSTMRSLLNPLYRYELGEESLRQILQHRIGLEVRSAREAHREWRKYRKLWEAEKND